MAREEGAYLLHCSWQGRPLAIFYSRADAEFHIKHMLESSPKLRMWIDTWGLGGYFIRQETSAEFIRPKPPALSRLLEYGYTEADLEASNPYTQGY